MGKAIQVIACDLGASGGKCFVGIFDNGVFRMKEVHRFAHESVPFHIADASGERRERQHWDDILIYQNLVKGLRAARALGFDRLDGIGIDTWGADGLFMTENGDALGKLYAYRDHRLDLMADAVKARVGAQRTYSITGIHFQPFNLSSQLCWASLNRPSWFDPGCFYLPVPSLFYYYLGGVKVVDSTFASVSQLMEASTRRWSREILQALAVPERILPEIVSPGATVGSLHAELAETVGINRASLIAVAGHDTASAYASAPVDNPGEALIISSGTWSLVGKLVPEPITSAEAMRHNFSNEGGIGNIRLLKNCMGGWPVQELKRCWQYEDGADIAWADMDRWAREAASFTAFINPDDSRFYNPASMQEAIAEYCRETGQPVPASRGLFLRVVYESLAMMYRYIGESIARVSGGRNTVIHIVGGGSKNVMLNQYTADATGLPVMAGPEEATAIGNCMVQAMGLNVFKSMADAMPLIREAFPIREFTPQEPGRWDEAYRRFVRMISASR